MIREDILYAYRQHLELTGRSRNDNAVEMTVADLQARIRLMADDEILTIDFFGGES